MAGVACYRCVDARQVGTLAPIFLHGDTNVVPSIYQHLMGRMLLWNRRLVGLIVGPRITSALRKETVEAANGHRFDARGLTMTFLRIIMYVMYNRFLKWPYSRRKTAKSTIIG